MHLFTEGSDTDVRLRSFLGRRYAHHRRLALEEKEQRQTEEQRALLAEQINAQQRAAEQRELRMDLIVLPGIIGVLMGLALLTGDMV